MKITQKVTHIIFIYAIQNKKINVREKKDTIYKVNATR